MISIMSMHTSGEKRKTIVYDAQIMQVDTDSNWLLLLKVKYKYLIPRKCQLF